MENAILAIGDVQPAQDLLHSVQNAQMVLLFNSCNHQPLEIVKDHAQLDIMATLLPTHALHVMLFVILAQGQRALNVQSVKVGLGLMGLTLVSTTVL